MNFDGTFTAYQDAATKTAVYPGQGEFLGLTYVTLGLAGEAGETAEQIKKTWRDDRGSKCFFCGSRTQLGICPQSRDSDTPCVMTDDIIVTEERQEKIIKELGDVLWYAAQICTELGISMSEVAKMNIKKLASRQEANLLHGEGSDR